MLDFKKLKKEYADRVAEYYMSDNYRTLPKTLTLEDIRRYRNHAATYPAEYGRRGSGLCYYMNEAGTFFPYVFWAVMSDSPNSVANLWDKKRAPNGVHEGRIDMVKRLVVELDELLAANSQG